MSDEEERAALFRWQAQERANRSWQLWRSLSGDAERRRQLDDNWEPWMPDTGWEPFHRLTRAERDTINS